MRIGYLVIAAAELVLLVIATRIALQGRARGFNETWILVALLVGLVYDNTILALGTTIGEGDLLHDLSIPRFVVHALLTPTLMVFCAASAGRLGVPGYGCRRRMLTWTAITGVAILIGVVTELVGLDLVPKTENGVLRYTHENPTVPAGTVATIIGLIIIGYAMARRARWPWVLVASVAMLLIAGAFPGTGVVTNAGELMLLIAMVVTAREALTRAAGGCEAAPAADRPPAGQESRNA